MTDSPDVLLMQEIHDEWNPAIIDAVTGTAIPAKFVAALIANESGGDPDANRFEPGVLTHLWNVVIGRTMVYGRIMRADLVNYVAGLSETPARAPVLVPSNVFQRLDELAHSWGLTQIMGYHLLEWSSIPAWYRTIDDLRKPESHLKCTALLLTQFANEFSLDLSQDFAELLHCWNAGSPTAATFDPAYVPNAINRMDLYGSISRAD